MVERLSTWGTTFASLQWLFFIFANTVVVPISIGTAFELPQHEIAMTLSSSLLFTGIACVLQGLFGHRYPVMEGHSGIMWGVILNLSLTSSSLGVSLTTIGGGIATGMLLAGTVVLILGMLKALTFIARIFTPMVMTVYLFLLTFQLIFIFSKGMLKITQDGKLDIPVSLFSISIVILVAILIIKGPKIVSNFAILIGMAAGWIGYVLLFQSEETFRPAMSFGLSIFPFGPPNLHIGIILITFLSCFINLSNTMASVQAAAKLFHKKPTQRQYNRSYLLNGFFSIGAALLGLVSYAPYASSIGFLESTRIYSLRPYLIGGGLMVLLGVFPPLGGILATLPITVGNAVLFVAYLQLLGTSFHSLNGYSFNSVTIYRLAFPLLVGVSIMSLDPKLFQQLPVFIQPIVANGFIIGVVLSILLEKLIRWDKVDQSRESSGDF